MPMITMGSHRLPASMVMGPTSMPWISTIDREIASRNMGKAQITSRMRESTVSMMPPKNPRGAAQNRPKRQKKEGGGPRDKQRIAPAIEQAGHDVTPLFVGAQKIV